MSFELIDDIDEKYPLERFTRDSVIKMNIASIMDKIRSIIIALELRIKDLEDRL